MHCIWWRGFCIIKVLVIGCNWSRGIKNPKHPPVQLVGHEFLKHQNKIYFDPFDLARKIPGFSFLESVIFNNFLSFFTNLQDIAQFLNRFVYICEFQNKQSSFYADYNLTQEDAKQLLVLNTLVSNRNVNKNVNNPVFYHIKILEIFMRILWWYSTFSF